MMRMPFLFQTLLVILPCCLAPNPSRAEEARPGRTGSEDRLLVKPLSGFSPDALARFHAQYQSAVRASFPGLGNLQVVSLPKGGDLKEMLRRYQDCPWVDYAEPDYSVRLTGLFPNDPRFVDGTLWALNNAGQNGGLANADIDAPEAWSAIHSAEEVVVAVVDSGIRHTHEDLASNMWTNPADGSHGINALTGTTDTSDENGHGTRVAGVIGSVGNNGLGTAGVAWQVRLMACKFTDQFGNGSVSDALTCLEYARTNGAAIVNASWGLDEFSLSLSNAIGALRAAGVIVVAAAGNDARDIDLYPRYPASLDLDNLVAVTATTSQDQLYQLGNIGATNVDLAAPGYGITSTDALSDSAYASDEGTSMATAFVSGAAALLRAAFPGDSAQQVIARILGGIDPLPTLDGRCVSGGRLNLRKALGLPVARPWLETSFSSPEGLLVLTLSGDPGRSYVIETSTDFSQWAPASTNRTGLAGTANVTNNPPLAPPARFYRARLAP